MPTTDPGVDAASGGAASLEALEQEREFLLRSLADLDDEHEAGDLEDADYRSLTDEYTARAAAVLRAIEALAGPKKRRGATGAPARSVRASAAAGESGIPASARPEPGPVSTRAVSTRAVSTTPPASTTPAVSIPAVSTPLASAQLADALRSRRRWRLAAVVVAVVGFGAVAAWAVAQSSGSRQAGQTATGNSQLSGTTVAGGIDPRIQTAITDVNNGDVADALKLFDAVLKDDPTQPVALADGGWLEAQAGLAGNRPDLVDAGLAQIVKAEQADSNFTDAHFFRGFLLLRAKNDAADAVTEFRTYLGMVDPSSPQVASVQALLQEAIKAAGTNVPAGPNAPSTTAASGSANSVTPTSAP